MPAQPPVTGASGPAAVVQGAPDGGGRTGGGRWRPGRRAARRPPDPPALAAYVARTENWLNTFALCTIWLAILPLTPVTTSSDLRWVWAGGRILLSTVFAVDLVIRARLSERPVRYVGEHPVLLAAVLFPPVRIIFSLRLLREVFHRGNLLHFLGVALLLFANFAIMVYAFENDAPGANIRTVGQAFWWAAVTVATVGYGDFVPVTVGGRITAVGLMALGITTLAVVTAQVASSFTEQARVARASVAGDDGGDDAEADERDVLHQRLARIEAMLEGRDPGPPVVDPRAPRTAPVDDAG